MRIDIAVGEVPWERELLAALAANRDIEVGRRLVDLAAAKDGTDLVITCPSVRGFTEPNVAAVLAHRRMLVLLDSIRPPWLAELGLDVRDVDDIDFVGLVAECATIDPTPRLQLVRSPDRGRITAFVGVSGGVGVTTLAWTYVQSRPDALLIDCNTEQPAVALLVGNGARSSTLRSALQELEHRGSVDLRAHAHRRSDGPAVLGPALHGDDGMAPSEFARLLLRAAEQFAEVVIDVGVAGSALLDTVFDSIDHVVLVTVATPLGMVRLCSRTALWTQRPTTVVVNRVRPSAAGSRHVATAMRHLVKTELGTVPVLVPDHVLDCDRGWLTGDWGAMATALDRMELPASA